MTSLPSDISSDAWLAAIVECTTDAIISKTLDGVVTSWNASAERIFGYSAEEMIGESILIIIPEERRQEEDLILGSIRRGERLEHFETRRRRKDGNLVDISTVSPIKEAGGRIVGVSKIARDITEERRSRETQRLLMREVNHRSKNLLAVIEAMVRQSVASATPAAFRRVISSRIAALSLTQDLIVRGEWQGVNLLDLVQAHLLEAAGDAARYYAISGPDVRISPNATQAIGIAVHELVAGSLQRLARAQPGTVAINWTTDQDGQSLAFGWTEMLSHGDGAAQEDDAFARLVLTKVTPLSLSGISTLSMSETGWRWTLTTKSDAAFGPQVVDPLWQELL